MHCGAEVTESSTNKQHHLTCKETATVKIFTYQGLRTCTKVDKSWTIMSRAYSHLWQGGKKDASELETIIRAEVEQLECFEAMGYRSLTWRLLRVLQSFFSALQLQGESVVTEPLFFPSAGRGTTRFWGKEQGPTIFWWESLGEEGREECEKSICTRRDWVVWSRVWPMKGDGRFRGFEHVGELVSVDK